MKRLDQWCEEKEIYMDSQYGFRKNKSIIQPCQMLQHLQWLSKTREEDIYVTFLDIAKAYDSVSWEILWEVLKHYGIPDGLIGCLKALFGNSELHVQFNGMKGKWCETSLGVPQGDPLSPLLFSIYMTFLFRDYMKVLDDDDMERLESMKEENSGFSEEDIKKEEEIIRNEGVVLHTVQDRECVPKQQENGNLRQPQVMIYRKSSVLNKKAVKFEVKKLLYADDTTLVSKSLEGAIRATTKHKKAAALGKLLVHPDKLVSMLLRNKENKVHEMYVDGVKVKVVDVEKYLGSRFKSVYDGGEKNIKTRIMIAKSKKKKMENIFHNKEIDYDMKLDLYRSDISSVLLHGAEYWHLSEKNINCTESFNRKSLLEIAGRNERDRIKSTDLYKWVQKRGKEIYPIRFVLAERKLRYFAMIERGDKEELARKIYWSDFVTNKVKEGDFEYEHMRDIKEALKILDISEEEMNELYISKKEWERKLRENKTLAFAQWCEIRDKEYKEKKLREIPINMDKNEKEEKALYKRRPLPKA